MRTRLLQIVFAVLFFATLAACGRAAGNASKSGSTSINPTDKLAACEWGTSKWGECTWQ